MELVANDAELDAERVRHASSVSELVLQLEKREHAVNNWFPMYFLRVYVRTFSGHRRSGFVGWINTPGHGFGTCWIGRDSYKGQLRPYILIAPLKQVP